MLNFTLIRSDDAPKLLAALKEMKDGLDLVRTKVESLARKVPAASPFPPPITARILGTKSEWTPQFASRRRARRETDNCVHFLCGGVSVGEEEPGADG